MLNKFQLELVLDHLDKVGNHFTFYDSNSENVKDDSKIKETILQVVGIILFMSLYS